METAVAKTDMLIRQPVEQVFAAFVDPAVTSKFWFSSASGPLEQGTTVRWEWAMYGASAQVLVKALEPNRRIVIEWPGRGTTNTVEWTFANRGDLGTLVSIRESGIDAAGSELA